MARSQRLRTCSGCGKIMPAKGESYYCDECRMKIQQGIALRTRTCRQCGASFTGGPRAWYCPNCRKEREVERRKKYRSEGFSRKLGEEYPCERCGKPYILEGGLQKYCKDCAEIAVKEVMNPRKREYQRKYDPGNEKRHAVQDGNRLCVICGKPIPAERATTPTVTCSDECDTERRRLIQNEADIRRGRRKSPADAKYDSGLPKSGIVGVTYHRKTGKWQVNNRHKYIGLYDTVEEAAIALEQAKKEDRDGGNDLL